MNLWRPFACLAGRKRSLFFCPRNTRRNAKERGRTNSKMAGKRSLPIAKIGAGTLPLVWRYEELLDWHHFISVLFACLAGRKRSLFFCPRNTRRNAKERGSTDSM